MYGLKFSILNLLLLFFAFRYANAQEKVVFPHTAFWTKFEIAQLTDNRWGYGLDVIYRSNNRFNQGSIFESWHRFSYRPWVHYQPNSNVRFSVSPLAYFDTQEYFGKQEDFDRFPYKELRTTFQVVHHHKNLGEKITHTFRHWYEIRYRNPFDEDAAFTFTRYRIRYRIRYLINKDYYSQKGVWYTYASNEVMVNYGQKVVYNMFSQNRVQLAVGYRILPAVRLEVRYMNRFRSRPSGFEYDNTQAIFFGVWVDQLSNLFGRDVRPVKFFD
jgi:hypothetical protein